MKVRVVQRVLNKTTQQYELEPICQLDGLRQLEAELVDYTNTKTNLPDPRIVYREDRWVHMSTVLAQGRQVVNADTGEVVKIPNLSPA